jgi:transcriptional regulator of acetoin/glycerol metabolism
MRMRVDHRSRIEAALSGSGAARSAVVASWSRSARLYGLDPGTRRKPERMDRAALTLARDRARDLIPLAEPVLDELFRAVGGIGCCVLLADDAGVPLEHRGAVADDAAFEEWGLWPGAIWTEDHEGTNAIGTCLAEGRGVSIHRDQHFLARNTGLSCMASPIHLASGGIAGVLDISSARNDLTEGLARLISHSVADAARRIEVDLFRAAHPGQRIVLLPHWLQGVGSVVAVDRDDIVVGLSHGARLALGLGASGAFSPRPLSDVLGQSVPDGFEDAERAVLVRALARADGNVSAAARALGISRATMHRKLGPRADQAAFVPAVKAGLSDHGRHLSQD